MIGHLLFSIVAFFPRAVARPMPRPIAAAIAGIGGPVRRLAMLVSQWLERGSERRRLQSLSDHMLRDFGVSRRDVER
jgi:uncharacterized protein YjiS (DUF1127 family)